MPNNTVFSAYNKTKEKLAAAGVEDFGFEARVIMRHITGFDNKTILMNYNAVLTDSQQAKLNEITERRAKRYPLQYILGEWEFFGLRFTVGEGVLIPRADTETAVETALKFLENKESPTILDLCAGSGAIGISIAVKRPDSRVTLLEKYSEAAKYLKENIKLNRAENAAFLEGDVLKGDGSDGKYDLIVSNPPYIKAGDVAALQPEVRFEPENALSGGEDGLDFYRAIAKKYMRALTPGGGICFEAGIDEAAAVRDILLAEGFYDVHTVKDLAGIERVVFGTVK
ncbi:MAG: peptide chain release factor N(5)-glutamine methyltransferase [Clostridia bacterium]|nr:peptide chain release factor N(5)-glutamine methyltransferase [Clostridia bacterium]